MGSGGLGGYFGFLLARAGNDVSFVARGPHLEAMRKNGLRLVTSSEDSVIQVKATDHPEEIGSTELVLFCVKTYDTIEAAKAIAPILDQNGSVLTLQNGIDNYSSISAVVGKDRVLPGGALIVSEVLSPGTIRVTTQSRKIVFGEIDRSKTPRVEKINAVFNEAGIDSEVSTEVNKFLWRKMVLICSLAGMTTITRLPIGKVMECKETRQMFGEVMDECAAVARAKGVEVGEDYVRNQIGFADKMEKDSTSSMLRDLLNGRRLELDALNGAIARFGKECKVQTPMNRAIYYALSPFLNGSSVG